MTSQPVRGHALVAEGSPHLDDGSRDWGDRYWPTTDGPGRAKCQCGELSEHLPSRRKRRDWHRAHKAAVLAGDPA